MTISRFKPYAVQREALARGYHKVGFCYFLEQGLGKTGLTLEEFSQKVVEQTAECAIIVSPGTFKPGWVAEITKYEWAYPIHGYVYQSSRERDNEAWLKRAGATLGAVLVINYEALRGDKCRDYIHRFIRNRPSYLTFDESVQISTHTAAQTKAAIDLGKYCTWKRVLSGRPQKSGPHDLWSQFRACGLIEGHNYFSWRNRYCEMGGFKGKAVTGAKNQEQLASTIRDFTFFASKKDWTDLPEKSWTVRSYELGPTLTRHYNEMLDEFVTFVEDDAVLVEAAITKYIKLAQIQSGFIMTEKGETIELVAPENNPRLLALRSFVDTELSGKLLIPYNTKYAGRLLHNTLGAPPLIGGGMAPAEVEENKRLFNEGVAPIMLLQTRAAKYGHTLLGAGRPGVDPCYTTAFFENTYSIDDRSQIEDRNHRHGQKYNVTYVDFVGTTEDSKMIEALQRKDSVFQALRGLVAARRGGATRGA